MSKKLLAIAFSDIHIHPFQAFAKTKYARMQISMEVMDCIAAKATVAQVPLIFCGDLMHDPKEIGNHALNEVLDHFKEYDKYGPKIIAISGNHDLSERNDENNFSPSYLSALSKVMLNLRVLDYPKNVYKENGLAIMGVPYLNDDDYLLKRIKDNNHYIKAYEDHFKILLLHTDLPSCPDPSGHIIAEAKFFPKKLDKLWDNFDLVLSGHIHKPWQVSNKAWMLGSPIHQNEGDTGCDMGYWEIYEDGPEFVSLEAYAPRFVQLGKGEEPYNDKDYFIPFEEEEDNAEEVISNTFSNKATARKLTKAYFLAKGIKSKSRRELLVNVLNEAKNL